MDYTFVADEHLDFIMNTSLNFISIRLRSSSPNKLEFEPLNSLGLAVGGVNLKIMRFKNPENISSIPFGM